MSAGPTCCAVSFFASCRGAFRSGQSKQDDRRRGQLGLFDDLEIKGSAGARRNGGNGHRGRVEHLPEVAEMSDADLLAGEKKALGFYLSSHPLTRHAGLLHALATHRAADLPSLSEKTEVILGGMITNVKERNVQKSRSGLTRMAKLTFEDLSGTTPAMLWPEEFAKMAEFVKDDQIVFVKGTLDRRRDPRRADHQPDHPVRARPRRAGARRRGAAAQGYPSDRAPRAIAPRSSESGPVTSTCTSKLVGLEHVRRAIYRAGASLAIRYDDRLIADLEAVVGPGNVRLRGQHGATARVDAGRYAARSSRGGDIQPARLRGRRERSEAEPRRLTSRAWRTKSDDRASHSHGPIGRHDRLCTCQRNPELVVSILPRPGLTAGLPDAAVRRGSQESFIKIFTDYHFNCLAKGPIDLALELGIRDAIRAGIRQSS